MADVTLPIQTASQTGITPTRTAIATGNTYKVRNSGNVNLMFEKTGSGAATITIVTPAKIAGLAVPDVTITVPATTGDITAGRFPPSLFNDSAGDLSFTTDDGAGLTCAVIAS